jgi:uncharacterized protein involved in type VI secretion and phage assembly
MKSARDPFPRLIGAVPAAVVALGENGQAGLVKVRFPWLDGRAPPGAPSPEAWAVCARPVPIENAAAPAPRVGDGVIVAFEWGELCRPYVIGILPPVSLVHSATEQVTILFDDATGALRVEDAHGRTIVEIEEGTVEIRYDPEG